VVEARHQDTICRMGMSEIDHRGETVVGVSPNVQENFHFSLKVSAEVSKVNCNPSARKTRTTQVTGVSEWLFEMVVDVWRFPSMYGSQQSEGQCKSAELRERESWMCRGSPQAVQDVAVQGHVGSDSYPVGSTLVQLLSAIASTYICATARP